MMEIDFEVPYLPLHITKLESPEGFRVWEREMQEFLIPTGLWKWTKEENREAPTAEIPDRANDGSNQLTRDTALAALEEKVLTWKTGHELACNAIVSRLGPLYFYEFRKESNACKLWNGIAKEFKPKDSVLLNELYRRLGTLSIGSCKDEADYTRQFKSIHYQILDIHPILGFGANFLTFLFYKGLGKEHQVRLPLDEERMPWA